MKKKSRLRSPTFTSSDSLLVVLPFIVMPVDADLNRTDVVSPGCELKGLRTWKDICLVRNSLFQHQGIIPQRS
ncbi:hypothetical protein evm_005164 [Chilo suppressalis]|nr:hypothetical protein evm_005164 [Chilo suppressalis]